MIKIGNTEIADVKLGSVQVSEVYLGSTKVWGGSSPAPVLPYDAEIEYLRGTGTQYIDSGIECTGDLSVKCKFRFSTLVNSSMAGGILAEPLFRHHLTPNSTTNNRNSTFYWLQNDSQTASIYHTVSTNTWYVMEIDGTNGTCKINNTDKTFTPVSGNVTTGANYGIFGRLSSDTATQIRTGNNDIAYWQLLKNGVLLRDYIPVRVGTTGYLYDRVSGQLFGNAGTGSFVLGNDVTT